MANLAQRIGQEFKTLRENELSLKLNANSNQEITGDLIPSLADTFTLGSALKPFKDLYVGANSLYVNGQQVISDNSGTIVLSADNDQNVQIKTEGSGDIEFLPNGTGTIQLKGNVVLSAGTTITTAGGSNVMESLELKGILKGPQTFTIDPSAHGDNTGTVVIAGNLQVDGTTTTINSSVLTVDDKAIIIADGAVDASAANGAGIIISDGTIANFTYNAVDDAFKSSVDLFANGYKVITTNTLSITESSLQSSIDSEVTRATASESSITSSLNAEASTARSAESVLTSSLNAEASTARSAESVLTSGLNTEVTRATAAESSIAFDISVEVNRATASESTITSNLVVETARAQGAESVLTSGLNAEVTRATAAESSIAFDISVEVNRATASESTIASSLNAEASTARSAESVLTSGLNAEVTRATAAESSIAFDIGIEVDRATASESTIASSLNAEASTARSAESVLTSGLNAEVTRATASESSITSSLNAEASTARSAESALQSSIDSINFDNLMLNTAQGNPGDMFYFDGSAWGKLSAGTAGQILTVGTDGLPFWNDRVIG